MLSYQSWVDQTTTDLEGTLGSHLRFQRSFNFQIYCSVSERERVKRRLRVKNRSQILHFQSEEGWAECVSHGFMFFKLNRRPILIYACTFGARRLRVLGD